MVLALSKESVLAGCCASKRAIGKNTEAVYGGFQAILRMPIA
ncbi:MAG: hypothetical protein ACFB0C_07165 [Leptolyngbyaceae cyanobacterium]